MNYYVETKTMKVLIQANGIIRRANDGWLIGRLCKDVKYEEVDKPPEMEKPISEECGQEIEEKIYDKCGNEIKGL